MTKPTNPTDAALVASRALVAIAARSMSEIGDLTLPQFRALVVLASHGPTTSSDLAAALSVHASTITRMVDRLAAKGYVTRSTPGDRREVVVAVTDAALAVIGAVSDARRRELDVVLRRLPRERRVAIAQAFEEFGAAAGEVPDSEWSALLTGTVTQHRPPGSDAAPPAG